MKAVVRSKYGLAEVLEVKDVERPVPKVKELLVRVHATTVNRSDIHVLTGKPFFMRFFTGLTSPTLRITGSDFAGQVEATGANAKRFKTGDRVMGFIDMGAQSHAEYLTIDESKVVPMPANATFEQAAACLEGAFYAISGIQLVNPTSSQNALVIGGTGAIGSSYIQFLKNYGTPITAVCGREHAPLVQSLGASRIIDYHTEDFTKIKEQFDLILDAVGKTTFNKCKHLLKPGGIFCSAQPGFITAFLTSFGANKKEIVAIPKNLIGNLNHIRTLFEEGKFVPVIDRKYSLEQIADAYTYVASGQKVGNVIITI